MEPEIRYRAFVSHKKGDEVGRETKDSLLAQKIHGLLTARGIPTFLAQDSITKLGETEYMRAIDHALDQADVLIVVTTSAEHLMSKWVQYEWESFVNDILSGRKENGRIFSYIDGITIDELPRPLRLHQALPHADGQIERLFEGVATALGISELGKVAVKGERAVDQFHKMIEMMAESKLLEMEIFSSGLGAMVMSAEQKQKMQNLITRMSELIPKTTANKSVEGTRD